MNLPEILADLHNVVVADAEPATLDNGDALLDRSIWIDPSADPPTMRIYDLASDSWLDFDVSAHTHPAGDQSTSWVPLANGDGDNPAYLFTPDGEGIFVKVAL